MGPCFLVKQLLWFLFHWGSLSHMHCSSFLWPECYEEVFGRTFCLLKSLAIVTAVILTAFLPWVWAVTVFPQLTSGICHSSQGAFTLLMWLTFLNLYSAYQKKAPRPKPPPLVSSNMHWGESLSKPLTMLRNEPAWTSGAKSAEKAHLPAAYSGSLFSKGVMLSKEMFLLSEALPELPLPSGLWAIHLTATGKSQAVTHRESKLHPLQF